MLEINNIVTETKNALDGLISKLDGQAQERTSDLEHVNGNFPNKYKEK